jgi:hypothetical protein
MYTFLPVNFKRGPVSTLLSNGLSMATLQLFNYSRKEREHNGAGSFGALPGAQ